MNSYHLKELVRNILTQVEALEQCGALHKLCGIHKEIREAQVEDKFALSELGPEYKPKEVKRTLESIPVLVLLLMKSLLFNIKLNGQNEIVVNHDTSPEILILEGDIGGLGFSLKREHILALRTLADEFERTLAHTELVEEPASHNLRLALDMNGDNGDDLGKGEVEER